MMFFFLIHVPPLGIEESGSWMMRWFRNKHPAQVNRFHGMGPAFFLSWLGLTNGIIGFFLSHMYIYRDMRPMVTGIQLCLSMKYIQLTTMIFRRTYTRDSILLDKATRAKLPHYSSTRSALHVFTIFCGLRAINHQKVKHRYIAGCVGLCSAGVIPVSSLDVIIRWSRWWIHNGKLSAIRMTIIINAGYLVAPHLDDVSIILIMEWSSTPPNLLITILIAVEHLIT